jgi:inner membrane protein
LLYGFVFVLIQLKDFALLAGSLGLFVILGGIMYISRNIEWDFESSQE